MILMLLTLSYALLGSNILRSLLSDAYAMKSIQGAVIMTRRILNLIYQNFILLINSFELDFMFPTLPQALIELTYQVWWIDSFVH